MNSTTRADAAKAVAKGVVAAVLVAASAWQASAAQPSPDAEMAAGRTASTLTVKQHQAIAPIAAATAIGDIPKLELALNQGLDAGLSVGETKEILVQMYAYAGFPRSLNALGELMKVVDARRQRGIQDAPGREPGPVPDGQRLLELGAAHQTKLVGTPVRGPLFEFAPIIDQYLKAHLFGALFARDNLDWQARELATVGALAAMPGVESQLRSHVGFSLNVGLSVAQLRQLADVLGQRGHPEAAARARAAIAQVASSKP